MTLGVVLGTLAIVAVTIAIGVLVDRKYRLLPAKEDFITDGDKQRKQLVRHAPGEAPATALREPDAQIDKLRASQRCAICRAEMCNDADDTVHYNHSDLLVLHFTCVACAAKRTLYLERIR